MMPDDARWPELWFEGQTDLKAIGELLKLHNCECHPEKGPVKFKIPGATSDRRRMGVESLLDDLDIAIRQSVGRPIGFVLDADTSFDSRWQSVADRLRKLDIEPASRIGAGGFVQDVPVLKTRVGIWLMPDCQNPGTLEDFLRSLIHDADPLIDHAEQSTDGARLRQALFRDVDRSKAILYTWLAWQARPGCPFGTAINNRYFKKYDCQAAADFVAWFRKLYGLAPDSSALSG